MKSSRRVLVLAIALAPGLAGGVWADQLPAPTGEVILEVAGKIASTTDGRIASFDMDAIKALGAKSLDRSTQWTEGVIHFEGASGADFVNALGAEGTEVVARALNDYELVIPIEDFRDGSAMIAYSMNGEQCRSGKKGRYGSSTHSIRIRSSEPRSSSAGPSGN